jgi:hypothetical protein
MVVFLILRGAEIHKKVSLDDNMIFVQTVHSLVITAVGKYYLNVVWQNYNDTRGMAVLSTAR